MAGYDALGMVEYWKKDGMLEYWSNGVAEIAEFGLRIADLRRHRA
jgi:hypothetical protein